MANLIGQTALQRYRGQNTRILRWSRSRGEARRLSYVLSRPSLAWTLTLTCIGGIKHEETIKLVEVADYTGPPAKADVYTVANVRLDVKAYVLKPEFELDPRLRSKQIRDEDDDGVQQVKIFNMPNESLHDVWNSLVYDDALPARLLRSLVRVVDMMSRPDLNLSTFNWNRLVLLHGPPGSGKSTLCRALAQKLSIRLGDAFSKSVLFEINTNAMLSKWFGESGKQVGAMFYRVYSMAQDRGTLVVVVMDEVETIAGSREKAASGRECTDGLRATNQLLTALDRLRNLPNVIVLCTSNLIEAIDPAFVDRVDIKQLIPCPSPAAIYNIFRSCLNEMIRNKLVDPNGTNVSVKASRNGSTIGSSTEVPHPPSSSHKRATRSKTKATPEKQSVKAESPSPEPWTLIIADSQNMIPEFDKYRFYSLAQPNPNSPAGCVWLLAQKCSGLSGRTLRRLPVLGLAMYTWGGDCSLDDALSALEQAVEQEMLVNKKADAGMDDV